MNKLYVLALAISLGACHSVKPRFPDITQPDTTVQRKPLTLLQEIKHAIHLNAVSDSLRAANGVPKKIGAGSVFVAAGATAEGINPAKKGTAGGKESTVGGAKAKPVAGANAAQVADSKNAGAAGTDATLQNAPHSTAPIQGDGNTVTVEKPKGFLAGIGDDLKMGVGLALLLAVIFVGRWAYVRFFAKP